MPTKFKVHGQKSGFRVDNRHRRYDIKRMNDPELGPVAVFRGSYRWQKVRRQKVGRNPTCEDPFKDHELAEMPALTQGVHHVIPLVECLKLGQLDRLGCCLDNLRSLCDKCHDRVERMDPTPARRLFLTPEEETQILIQCDVIQP